MSYKNAFNCRKCPQNADKDGCPCWIELIWTNDDTGEVKTEKSCYFQLTPKLLLEVVRAAHVSSEHSSVARNAFEQGFMQMQDHLQHTVEAVKKISKDSEE